MAASVSGSSEIARLKSKFEAKKNGAPFGQNPGSAPPRSTPAFYEQKQKELKQKENHAAKVAKQSAARYNLTLRALALTSAKKAQDERARDLTGVNKAKEEANKYNATARAVKVAVAGVTKKTTFSPRRIQKKITEGDEMGPHVTFSPSIDAIPANDETKPEPLSLAAANDVESKSDDEPSVEQSTAVVDALAPASESSEPASDNQVEEKDQDSSKEQSENTVTLAGLEQAINSGDDQVLNEVLVRTFLEEVNPERAGEASKLLEEYKGKEEELMQTLLKEAPAAEPDQLQVESLGSPSSAGQEVGFITSVTADPKSDSWTVTMVQDTQTEAFRNRLKAKGMDEKVIDQMLDDTSEML